MSNQAGKEQQVRAKILSEDLAGKTISHVSFEPHEGFLIHLQDGSFVEMGGSAKVNHHIPDGPEAEEAKMRVFIHALDRMAKAASQVRT